MPGIGKDAVMLHIRSRIEQQHLMVVKGGDSGNQLGALKKGAQAFLKLQEVFGRNNRILVDQISGHGRYRFGFGHINRPEDGQAIEAELLGRQEFL